MRRRNFAKRCLSIIALICVLVCAMPMTDAWAAATIKAPTATAKLSGGNPVIQWKAVKGAAGYGVYRKTATDSKYVLVAKTTKLSCTDKKWKAKKNTKISYIVKGYQKDSKGKLVWGKASKAVSCKVTSTRTGTSAASAKNGIDKFSQECYDLYFYELSNGLSAKDYADKESLYRGFTQYKLAKFAIAGSDGKNPYLLLSGDIADKKEICECTYIFSFYPGEDGEEGYTVDTDCNLGQGGRQLGVGSDVLSNQLYLNKSKNIVFSRVEHEQGQGYDDYYVYNYDKRLKDTYSAGQKSTVSTNLKSGTYSEIKWYKMSEIEKAKKDLKKYITD